MPSHLKRERIEHDLTEEDKHCASCSQDLRPIGEESSERYEYIPKQMLVIEEVCKKYACACTVRTATKARVKPGPLPEGLEDVAFHLKVGCDVPAGGGYRCMAEIVANHRNVATSLEERNGATVAHLPESRCVARDAHRLAFRFARQPSNRGAVEFCSSRHR